MLRDLIRYLKTAHRNTGNGWQKFWKKTSHVLNPIARLKDTAYHFAESLRDKSPDFPGIEHLQHLQKLDLLCRQGKFEQAKAEANSDIAIEQELIAGHYKIYSSSIQSQINQPVIAPNVRKIEQPINIDIDSIRIAHESQKSPFPVNAPAVSIMKEYGKDIKEITNFKATSLINW